MVYRNAIYCKNFIILSNDLSKQKKRKKFPCEIIICKNNIREIREIA